MTETKYGRCPPGRATRPEDQAASHLGDTASVLNAAWRTDSPPFDKRPIWQCVWVQGELYHSGTTWFRQGWGTAAIRTNDAEDGYLGYRRSDIERICRDNDMEPSCAVVVGWLPMVPPALLREEELRPLAPSDDGEYAASAIEAPSGVETGNTGSTEGESATRQGDAQTTPGGHNG